MFIKKIMLRLQQNIKYLSMKSKMNSPEVAVKEGKLRGSVQTLNDGSEYYSFKGIPYASPPLGELRFKAPEPPKQWQGVRDATLHANVCPQYDMYTSSLIEGSEDCLFLNIYTKTLEPSSKLPIMVFIHGGGFMSGSGDDTFYGPEYLLQHNVLLITLNYRLEALGILCLDTPGVPGNAGLKDQVAALRWIKENVSTFGGDPDNVTLFGESAGGSAVTYHMLSPMSKGLFHKAIAQSGVCINDWSTGSNPKERAFRLGKLLGKETKDENDLLRYLQSLPALDLTKITLPTRTEDEIFRGLPMHFVPVTEKKFDNIEQFLTEDPMDVLLQKQVNQIPLIIGYNTAEGIITCIDQIKKATVFNKNPSLMLPKEIAHRVSKEKCIELAERLKRFYFGEKGLSKDNAQAIVDLQTDRQFAYNTHRFVNYYSKIATTFLYKFDCVTDLNIAKAMMGIDVSGACHTDELYYMFSTEMTRDLYEEQEKLKDIVFKVTKLWTNFAKTGNPTPDSSADVKWNPFNSTQQYLHMGESFETSHRADRERIAFWDELYADSKLPCIRGIQSNL